MEWLRDNSKESECDLQLLLTLCLLMQAHFQSCLVHLESLNLSYLTLVTEQSNKVRNQVVLNCLNNKNKQLGSQVSCTAFCAALPSQCYL